MKERLLDWWRKNRAVALVVALFWGLGLYMGWGHGVAPQKAAPTGGKAAPKASAKKTIWTCSMHPQIRLPKKTKCPICFMDLIPLEDDGGGAQDPRLLRLSKVGKLLAEIRTTKVERRPVFLELGMFGRVAYDETRIKAITAWVPGRLERLFVDYTGVPVRRGDHLVRIYSPELLAAQQELLQTHRALQRVKRRKQGGIVLQTAKMAQTSARQKLSLLGLRSWQIKKLLRKGKPSVRINIYAPMGGIVIRKKAVEGMYVKTGTLIYTIADLSQVWIKFEAYERDLPWLHVGQDVTFTTSAYPGKGFKGQIVYIDPMLNPKTRTISVRVNAKNAAGLLKPGMFVRGHVHSSVGANGRARAPDRSGKWICPMHPEIVSKRRINCKICGMRLARIRSAHDHKGAQDDPLVIPHTAPLMTGRRSLVYLAVPNAKKPTYVGKEVTLGPRAGDYFVVLDGLKEGDEVVTQGAFKLDSELQLKAKKSMMLPGDSAATPAARPKPRRPSISRRALGLIQPMYDAYFALFAALAGDDPGAARKAYERLWTLLRKRKRLPGKAQALWAKHRSKLYDAVKEGRKHEKIDAQRKAFEPVSQQIIALEKAIGHGGMKPYHLTHCPMAFNNRGAYWLQPSKKELLNPYFGKKMLHCGSFKQAFVGREGEPVEAKRAFVKRLKPIYDAYLTLQHALFKDKFADAMAAAKQLQKALPGNRRRYLQAAHRKRWSILKKRLKKHAAAAVAAKDIKALRVQFEPLSKDVMQLLYIFGHVGKKALFEAYCPMAFNNKGAAWVQANDDRVHNSYFGAQMAFCGSIRRKFIPRFR